MGAADAEEDERPVHRVYVSEFFIGRFPVTNDEYAQFVHATGHPAPVVRGLPLIAQAGARRCSATARRRTSGTTTGRPRATAAIRSCSSATTMRIAYCEWLSGELDALGASADRSGVGEGRARRQRKDFAFPGATTSMPPARTISSIPRPRPQRGTRATGTYPPNAYGLCDICGNVWEWVADWYGADYYGLGDTRDPRGPQTGNVRVVRGGSWVNDDVGDVAMRLSAQSAARHVLLQRRIQDRMRRVVGEPSAARRQPSASPKPSALTPRATPRRVVT